MRDCLAKSCNTFSLICASRLCHKSGEISSSTAFSCPPHTFACVTPPPSPGRLMSAQHCVELGLFNLYLPFSQVKKNIYIYIINTTVVVFMFYTLSPITSQYTKLIPIPKIQRLRKQCGEHLSLSWPALLMWDVLSSILVFCFCTCTD